jgi:Putative MetA-pathway of phenol degradation
MKTKQQNITDMSDKPNPFGRQNHSRSAIRPRPLGLLIAGAALIGPMLAQAQVPPRFYWQSLAGANAVPVIFQSLSGNANPIDPAHAVDTTGSVDANVAIVGYAKMLPLFDRTLTLAVLEPMGRISSDATFKIGNNTVTQSQDAKGFGDPMLEVGYNVIGPKAIKNIPDLLRYEPGFSVNVIADIAFPIGNYDGTQPLNLGQNRWYGRVGTPIVYQIGEWVPGRRTTLELLPSVWVFSDNNDYVGQTLSTDPMFQLEAHLTRDLTETLWGSLDTTVIEGGKSTVSGASSGDAINSWGVGATLGYQINDNLALTAGYMSTVNDNGAGKLKMDGFRLSLTYGWHPIVEGQKRLKSEQ